MTTTSGDYIPSCGSRFCVWSNTGGLVGMERDLFFDTIILRCDARSSGVKAFLFLGQYVLRSS